MSDSIQPGDERHADRPKSIVRAVAPREQLLEPSGALGDPFAAPEQAHRGSTARPMTLGLLWQHKWLALVVFLVFSIPVVAAIWILFVPTYSANAIIEVDPNVRGILDDNNQVPYYNQFRNTQVAAIDSPRVLRRVLEDPQVRETSWYKNPPRLSALRSAGQELDRLLADLTVRSRANTSYVDVEMSTRNPKEAALIVNTVVDKYIEYVQDRAQQSNDVVYGVVVQKYNELRARIKGLNSSIAKWCSEIGHGMPYQLLAQQRARLDEKEAELEALLRKIRTAERLQAMAPPSSQPTTAPGEGSEASLANASDSEPVTVAETYLYELDRDWLQLYQKMQTARRRVEDEQHLGDKHPRMIELRRSVEHAQEDLSIREAQLDEVWRTRPQELLAGGEGGSSNAVNLARLEAVIDRLKVEYDLGVEFLKLEGDRVSRTAEIAKEWQRDQNDLKDAQDRCQTLSDRKDDMELDRHAPASIHLLSRAYPTSQSGNARKRMMLMAMGLFGGVMLGLAAAYLRAVTASSVQHAEDLGQAVSLPFLGHLPLVRAGQAHGDSVQAEYVRMVRTALLQRLEEGGGKVVQITSAGSGAGKTTLAVMLAESLARCGKNVLLVDADLRHPSVHERCDIAAEPGLLGVLKARVGDPEAIVRPDHLSGISVLPVGRLSADADGELLANGVLAGCLRRWCGQFDLVLLDSAPVLPVADARILSRLVDGTIMVVREKHCHRSGVADALAQLGASGGALLGMVFVGSRLGKGYGGGYYDYRYPAAETTAALDVREG